MVHFPNDTNCLTNAYCVIFIVYILICVLIALTDAKIITFPRISLYYKRFDINKLLLKEELITLLYLYEFLQNKQRFLKNNFL